METHPAPWLSYVIPTVIIALVLALRLRRMSRGSRLRLERLWIVPALYAALAATLLRSTPPAGIAGWTIVSVALAVGAAIGWQRGRTIRISVDRDTHELNQRASPLTMLLLVGLILVRMALRTAAAAESAAWHLDAALVTDAFVAMALGLLTLTRLEMYLRGQRLLTEARGHA